MNPRTVQKLHGHVVVAPADADRHRRTDDVLRNPFDEVGRELFMSHSSFVTRAGAIQWAETMRKEMESDRWGDPLPPVPIPYP